MAPDVGRIWPNISDPPRSQIIEWAPYLLQLTIADMGVELGCSATAVA